MKLSSICHLYEQFFFKNCQKIPRREAGKKGNYFNTIEHKTTTIIKYQLNGYLLFKVIEKCSFRIHYDEPLSSLQFPHKGEKINVENNRILPQFIICQFFLKVKWDATLQVSLPPQVPSSLQQGCNMHPGGAFSGPSGSPTISEAILPYIPSSSLSSRLPKPWFWGKSAPWLCNLLKTNAYHLCHCFYLH